MSASKSLEKGIKRKRVESDEDDEDEDQQLTSNDNEPADKVIPSELYVCRICPDSSYFVYNNKRMSQHIQRKHRHDKFEETNEKLMPKDCLLRDPVLIKSILAKKPKLPFVCNTCGEDYKSAAALRTHNTLKHSETFRFCCIDPCCGRFFYSPTDLSSHFKSHDGLQYNDDTRSQCEELMTKVYKEAAENKTEVKQPMFPCPCCPKEFKYPHLLKNHFKTHNDTVAERTCQTQTCSKVFTTSFNRKRHEQLKHDRDSLPFVCELNENCQQRFCSNSQLIQHQNYSAIHNSTSGFSCKTCNRRFFWPSQLKRHQDRPCAPLTTRRYRYRCDVCKQGYYLEKCYKKHVQRHKDGTLNLRVPSTRMIKKYRKMIFKCNMAIRMYKCNKNKVSSDTKAHVIVVPCKNCPKRAIMFSSAETPWHHVRNLLYSMITGRACTSLHDHMDSDHGKGHVLDVMNAHFVVGAQEPYEAQIVKKILVKMSKLEEDDVRVTNFTEYEIYHEYDESAIEKVIQIMINEGLTSKREEDLRADINTRLKKFLNEDETTVRQHRPLVFQDNIFQRVEKDDESVSSNDLQLIDEITEDGELDLEMYEEEEEED